MKVTDLLNPKKWRGNTSNLTIEASTKKYLDSKASEIHNIINKVNHAILKGKYVVKTILIEDEKDTHYILEIEIKYYGNKKKHKHKKNSHEQKNLI